MLTPKSEILTNQRRKKVLENRLQKHRAKLRLTVHPAARKLAATAMQLRPESSSLISRGAGALTLSSAVVLAQEPLSVCHLTCEDFKLTRKEGEFTFVQVAVHVLPPARDQPRTETDGEKCPESSWFNIPVVPRSMCFFGVCSNRQIHCTATLHTFRPIFE